MIAFCTESMSAGAINGQIVLLWFVIGGPKMHNTNTEISSLNKFGVRQGDVVSERNGRNGRENTAGWREWSSGCAG